MTKSFIFPPVSVPRGNPHERALRDAVARAVPDKEVMSVGRDGASGEGSADGVAQGAGAVEKDLFAVHGYRDTRPSMANGCRIRRNNISFFALPSYLKD